MILHLTHIRSCFVSMKPQGVSCFVLSAYMFMTYGVYKVYMSTSLRCLMTYSNKVHFVNDI